jgi:hypothetical protein
MKTIRMILIVILLAASSLCACTKQIEEPVLGKYVTGNGHAWVSLDDNYQFSFNRDFTASYLPYGTYSLDEDTLILYVSTDEQYKFTIEADMLVFEESTGVGAIVLPGTEFTYDPDWAQ